MVIKAVVTRPFFNRAGLFVFSVMFVASMIAGSHLFAQDDPMGKRKGPPPEGVKEHTPEDMAEHMSKMLEEKLSLTSDQKTKVYDIVLAYASSHDRSNFDHNELDGKIEVVLNADQKDKFREFIKNGPPKNPPPPNGNDDGTGINK